MAKTFDINNIPKDKFVILNHGEKILDQKFEDKPIGYFKDALIRFKKSKASVVAAFIILLIILYAFLTPYIITSHSATFMVSSYAKKPSYIPSLAQSGIADGAIARSFSERSLTAQLSVGVAAVDEKGTGKVSIAEGLKSKYQPVLNYAYDKSSYKGEINAYMEVGFMYKSIEQADLQKILDFEKETGLKVLYPLIANNEYTIDATNANYWYKMNAKGDPIKVSADGEIKKISLTENTVLEDNYLRDENGDAVYWIYTGGGNNETASLKVRVLYYNYYQYLYGAEPCYILGTDSQGYDMALRLAGGIKLSLLVAVTVCIINFVLGAMYGAIEGYYGGAVDLIMERISDILYDIPFVICATLFQLHLAKKVGTIPCLLFTYVLTGWIGTASRVRTQFYRFKNQEYVMAARTLGAKDSRVIWKHIFPNTLGTIITSSALAIPGVISSESMLSYLGIVKLGTAEVTSLGTLLSDASGIWTNYPHLMICPALVISLLMICFNLFGNGLRDAFNPALRGTED